MPECNSRETQLLGSTTLTLQLNLIWANPWQTRSLWISPKGVPGQKMSGTAAPPGALLTKKRGQRAPVQKPRRKSNNSVIGEGFDHIYFLYRQLFLNSSSSPEQKKRNKPQPTNPHTRKKKNHWVKEKRWGRFIFIFKDWGKRCLIFSTNIKLQQIDQRIATVIRHLIRDIWKERKNSFSWLPSARSYHGRRKYIRVQ